MKSAERCWPHGGVSTIVQHGDPASRQSCIKERDFANEASVGCWGRAPARYGRGLGTTGLRQGGPDPNEGQWQERRRGGSDGQGREALRPGHGGQRAGAVRGYRQEAAEPVS